MDRDRVLLQIKRKQERRKLEDWLAGSYRLMLPDAEAPLSEEFDLAILDGASMKEHRQQIRERRSAEDPVFLPFVLLTTRRPGSMPARHLGTLVDDLVLRPLNEKELKARLANLLRFRRWSVELKKEHDRAMKLAVTDDVSGFHNTRYLHRFLDRQFENAAVKATQFCLAFFDLDNFKHLVDRHGHLLGSKALREVAQAVHRVLDEDDRLVRYGGDEFIVVLPRQTKDEALVKVELMKRSIANTRFLQKEGINAGLTASFGLAGYPEDAQDKRELLAAADQCLFRSKTQGKNRITSAEPNFALRCELQPLT